MTVKIKVTTIEEVTANQIASLATTTLATFTDGTTVEVSNDVIASDWQLINVAGVISYLSDADFQSAKLSETA